MAQLLHALQGRYLPRCIVGSGGYGKVFKADDIILQRPVALKEIPLRPDTALYPSRDPVYEARVLAALEHTHIPAVHTVFFEEGFYYIVMQWVEGERLDTYRKKWGSTVFPFPLASFFTIALQLCRILRFLHERATPLIYRDLKPQNILITKNNKVYLTDMGGVKMLLPNTSFDDDSCFSRGYVAPEVEKGIASSSVASDIYSLSVTLYELFTNRRIVWLDEEAHISCPSLPELEEILRKGTARNPMHRPQNICEIEQVLKQLRKRRKSDIIIDTNRRSPLVYSQDSSPFPAHLQSNQHNDTQRRIIICPTSPANLF